MKRKKLPSAKTLRNKLDDVFSIWIRARDANDEGFGNCISCGQFRELQCGHFIRRQHSALRWDPRNSHGQCAKCNMEGGSPLEYQDELVKRYGQEVVDDLRRLKHTTGKFTRSDLLELIERYQGKIAELEVV